MNHNSIRDFLFSLEGAHSRSISEQLRRGIANKTARGGFVGRAPLGYYNVRSGYGASIEVDPTRAPLIREAFILASRGVAPRQVTLTTITAKGLRTRRGNSLALSDLLRILTNPIYKGSIRFGEVFVTGVHLPLVSGKQFQSAQRFLAQYSTGRQRAAKAGVQMGGSQATHDVEAILHLRNGNEIDRLGENGGSAPPRMDPTRYILYIRAPRSEQREGIAHASRQLTSLLGLARAQALNVVRIVDDTVGASRSCSRPAFSAMLEDIRQGTADGILCESMDRLTRNLPDAARILALFESGALKRIVTLRGFEHPTSGSTPNPQPNAR